MKMPVSGPHRKEERWEKDQNLDHKPLAGKGQGRHVGGASLVARLDLL